MGDIANITLSKDLIEPIVMAQLQASITSALGRSDLLVAQVVQTIMNSKVDSEGKPGRGYSSDTTLISWMATNAIKGAAHEALKEWFADNKDELKKQIKAAIQKNCKGMAEAFVLNMTKSVETTLTSKVEVFIRPKE